MTPPRTAPCKQCGAPFVPGCFGGNERRYCSQTCRVRAASDRNYRKRKLRVKRPKPPRGATGPTHVRTSIPDKPLPGDAGRPWRAAGKDVAYVTALRASGGGWA